jgi:hypothetical protein
MANLGNPEHALTKEEHDLLVELLGRPVTQGPPRRRPINTDNTGMTIIDTGNAKKNKPGAGRPKRTTSTAPKLEEPTP